jgi:two-component system sensor histidine kinase KdpD
MRSRVNLTAVGVSVAVVAGVTLLIFALKPIAPVVSLGALYVLAVLAVAIGWGLSYALPVSVASMLAFNFFFLEPVHTFTISDARNWTALSVYLVTAIVASDLATRAKRRAEEAERRGREAALLADLAARLLERGRVEDHLDDIAARSARVLGLPGARLELGPPRHPGTTEAPLELSSGGRRIGTLYVEEDPRADAATRERFLAALASLLAVATERERLEAEAFEAEALRRSDAIKTAVIQSVSHDLRTPLATMEAALGGLESGVLELTDEDRAALLETIRLELTRLTRLVENLLDLSRLQAGAAEPRPELWTADQLVSQALDDVADSSRVQVVVPDGLPLVRVDAIQVQRVLVNLIENALKFSPPEESVLVRVTATRRELIVRVVDRGPGIGEGDLERIFEPFHRASSSRDRRGAGLGLAIARGFTEANGGRLWAESHEGQGASFALALPVADVPAPVAA